MKFTLETAPDYASRLALFRPVRRLGDGAAPGTGLATAVHANFARVIEQNFACASPARVARWLDGVEARTLPALAQAYVNATEHEGRQPLALDILAHRLDAERLARLAQHFGHARLRAAVLKVAPAKLDVFNALADVTHCGPVPGDMDLHRHEPQAVCAHDDNDRMFFHYSVEEIFLAFRTAPIGATSVSAAMYQTGLLLGSALGFQWNGACALRGYLVQGSRVYAPSVWRGLVDAVPSWMQVLTAAALLPPHSCPSPELQMGQAQRDGFLHVYKLDAGIYDDFAIGAGDCQSAWQWAHGLPPHAQPGRGRCE